MGIISKLRVEWIKLVSDYGWKRIVVTIVSIIWTMMLLCLIVNGVLNTFFSIDVLMDAWDEGMLSEVFTIDEKLNLIFLISWCNGLLLTAILLIWVLSKLFRIPNMVDRWFFKKGKEADEE